ncbi:hypothetical protein LZ30DRAFT_575036, partial [Colletotrichum cereale]
TPRSTDPYHSFYTFQLHPSVHALAESVGADMVHVIQTCDHDGGLTDPWTHNEGFTMLDKSGPKGPYTVQVDRCDKGANRQPVGYEIRICPSSADGTKCRDRKKKPVCPVAPTRAVDVTDRVPWVC